MRDRYESPLSSRYASETMLSLFSARERIRTWRRLWVALARAESKLGLPVTEEQVRELETNVDNIDFDASPLIYGQKDLATLGQDLLDMVVETARGKQTKAEALGYTEMAIARVCNYV